MIVALYLAAVVAANLVVASVGPSSVLWVGFALIGLTLVARDYVHDRWSGDRLALRMGALIAVGAAATAVLQPAAGRIALASVLAFVVAETADAVVYQGARRWPWLVRSNGSNVVSGLLDSAVFILVAFGGPWQLVLAQWAVKVLGGLVWSLLFDGARRVLPRHA